MSWQLYGIGKEFKSHLDKQAGVFLQKARQVDLKDARVHLLDKPRSLLTLAASLLHILYTGIM
jgi:hypothetical protein